MEDTILCYKCPLYSEIRHSNFDYYKSVCPNFSNLSAWSKFLWLFTNEDTAILKTLGNYIIKATEMRKEKLSSLRSV